MKRPHWLRFHTYSALAAAVAFVVGWTAAVFTATRAEPTHPPAEPVSVHYAKLPPLVYAKGEHIGERVRVPFYRPLTPTADPLIYLFHPGEPADVVPPTYRLHFSAPPVFTDAPYIVVGTVDGIESDMVKRLNGVPGVVVLRGCHALPASP